MFAYTRSYPFGGVVTYVFSLLFHLANNQQKHTSCQPMASPAFTIEVKNKGTFY